MSYEASLKAKRDYESVLITARRQGEQVGIEKGLEKGRAEERAKAEAEKLADKLESAKKMLASGFKADMISDILGLSIQEIENLK